LDLKAHQLVQLFKDNTDRNRTSPLAFTGNKFEFRAVGGSQTVGLPLTILNAAVADVLRESNEILEKEIKGGKKVDQALLDLTKKWMKNSMKVIFNGDGYSEKWLEDAEKKGLHNLKTTADALETLTQEKSVEFLKNIDVFNDREIKTRYNVLLERYNKHRVIEFDILHDMVDQFVFPDVVSYKNVLLKLIKNQKEVGLESNSEPKLLEKLNIMSDKMMDDLKRLCEMKDKLVQLTQKERSMKIAYELLPLAEEVGDSCSRLEEVMPDNLWTLPKYYDLLFIGL